MVGGWWAHFEFTRINITPTILRKKIEQLQVLGAIRNWLAATVGEIYEYGSTIVSGLSVANAALRLDSNPGGAGKRITMTSGR